MGSVAERRVDWEESELGEAARRPTEENWSMSPRKPRRVGGCSADADAEAEVERVGGGAGAGTRRGSGPWEAERRERVSVAARTWAERPAMALGGRRRAGEGRRASASSGYLLCSRTIDLRLPFLALLVSAGHMLLLLVSSRTSFPILATTLDDSIGNTYDKLLKLLQVPSANRAAGTALERFAASHKSTASGEREPLPVRGPLTFSYTRLHSTVGAPSPRIHAWDSVA